MIWTVLTIVFAGISIYLGVRVYRLRKGLDMVMHRLADIERKVLVLKP